MLEVKNLEKTFYPGTEDENVLFDGLNISFARGRSTALIGPNGCGKSTLLNLISGSLVQDGGEIVLDDILISEMKEEDRAKFIGKVNQDPSLGVAPSLTVLENMAMAMRKGRDFGLRNLLKNTDTDLVKARLAELGLGLEKKLTTQVKFLSGGQRQSLSLLMATLNKPDLLLLDEHTAALDPKTSRIVMNKTKKLIEDEGVTTLMISHDFEEAISYADRVIMLNQGQLVFDIGTDGLTKEDLDRKYQDIIEQTFAS